MLKEELKQEAEESLDKMVTDKGIILGCHEGFCYDEVTDFMTEFVKPREKRIAELEAQIKKMKADVELARDNANETEDWETFSVLNLILDDWEIKEK